MAGAGKGRKRWLCGALALCLAFLTACGGEPEEGLLEETGFHEGAEESRSGETGEEDGKGGAQGSEEAAGSQKGEKHLDVAAENRSVFPKKEGDKGLSLGMQYYQGEPALLWAVRNLEWDAEAQEASRTVNVYLKKADGSSTLLMEGVSDDDTMGDWYVAQDGSIYCLMQDYARQKTCVVKRDGQGQELYRREHDLTAADICQLADGRLFLLLTTNGSDERSVVAELDPDTGSLTEMKQVQMGKGIQYIGVGLNGLLVIDVLEEIREVNPEDGSKTTVLAFANTSFDMMNELTYRAGVEDFRMLEDGSVEILKWKDKEGTAQTLRMAEVDKAPVVVRGFHFDTIWIRKRVADFNKSSDSYHIVLQEPGESMDWNDFAAQTSVEIAAGKGPDILYGTVLNDYIQGVIDKGGLEDLKPYMERTGIKEEDYFPIAFSSWRSGDSVYGINVTLSSYRFSIDASVLGGKPEPDPETLADALLTREEKGMYARFCDAQDILELFLAGSEDFWGMIDWERGTCDFSGQLFTKLLQVAKEYAYDENLDRPILAERINCDSLLSFDAPSVQEKKGIVTAGILFDDGCHPAQNSLYQIFAINANSGQKEGAWEFIRFLLGKESQMVISDSFASPVLRTAFDEMVQGNLKELKKQGSIRIGHSYLYKGKYVETEEIFYDGDITEEWVTAFTRAAEDTRPLPVRTAPLLDIICQEAQDYFGGIKNVDEVVSIIRNRVQLYLDENN